MKLFKLDPNGEPRLWVCVVVDTVDGWHYERGQGRGVGGVVPCRGGRGMKGDWEAWCSVQTLDSAISPAVSGLW